MEQEISVLDQVYGRLLNTPPEKLGVILDSLLPALMQRIPVDMPTNAPVIAKISSVFEHILRRIDGDNKIQIPCEKLIDFMQAQLELPPERVNHLVLERIVEFLEVGFPRLEVPIRGRLTSKLPNRIHVLDELNLNEALERLLAIILFGIQNVMVNSSETWGSSDARDKLILFNFFKEVMLFNPHLNAFAANVRTSRDQAEHSLNATERNDSPPDGLIESPEHEPSFGFGSKRIPLFNLKRMEYSMQQAIRNQINVLNLLERSILPIEQSSLLFLTGNAVGINHEVKRIALRNVESLATKLAYNDINFIRSCIEYIKGKATDGLDLEELDGLHAVPRTVIEELFERIFLKSVALCEDTHLCLKLIIFAGFLHKESDKLKALGLDLGIRFSKLNRAINVISEIGSVNTTAFQVCFSYLKDIIFSSFGNASIDTNLNGSLLAMRQLEIVGEKICNFMGELFFNRSMFYEKNPQQAEVRDHVNDVQLLFVLIEEMKANKKLRLALQDCLSKMQWEFKDASHDVKSALLTTIKHDLMLSNLPSCRFIASEWAQNVVWSNSTFDLRLQSYQVALFLSTDDLLMIRSSACQGLIPCFHISQNMVERENFKILLSEAANNRPIDVAELFSNYDKFPRFLDALRKLYVLNDGIEGLTIDDLFGDNPESQHYVELCKGRPLKLSSLLSLGSFLYKIETSIRKSFVSNDVAHNFAKLSWSALLLNDISTSIPLRRDEDDDLYGSAAPLISSENSNDSLRQVECLRSVAASALVSLALHDWNLVKSLVSVDNEFLITWLGNDLEIIRRKMAVLISCAVSSSPDSNAVKDITEFLRQILSSKLSSFTQNNLKQGALVLIGEMTKKSRQLELIFPTILSVFIDESISRSVTLAATETLAQLLPQLDAGHISHEQLSLVLKRLAQLIFIVFDKEGVDIAKHQREGFLETCLACFGSVGIICAKIDDELCMNLYFNMLLGTGLSLKSEYLHAISGKHLGSLIPYSTKYTEFILKILLIDMPLEEYSSWGQSVKDAAFSTGVSKFMYSESVPVIHSVDNRRRSGLVFWLEGFMSSLISGLNSQYEKHAQFLDLVEPKLIIFQRAFSILLRQTSLLEQQAAARGLAGTYVLASLIDIKKNRKTIAKLKESLLRCLSISDSGGVPTSPGSAKTELDLETGSLRIVGGGSLLPEFKQLYLLAARDAGSVDLVFKLFFYFSRDDDFWPRLFEKDQTTGLMRTDDLEIFYETMQLPSNVNRKLLPIVFCARHSNSKIFRRVLNKLWQAMVSRSTENDISDIGQPLIRQGDVGHGSSEDYRKYQQMLEKMSTAQFKRKELGVIVANYKDIMFLIEESLVSYDTAQNFVGARSLSTLLAFHALDPVKLYPSLEKLWLATLNLSASAGKKGQLVFMRLLKQLQQLTLRFSTLRQAAANVTTAPAVTPAIANLVVQRIQREIEQQNLLASANPAGSQPLTTSNNDADDEVDIIEPNEELNNNDIKEDFAAFDSSLSIDCWQKIIPVLLKDGLENRSREVQFFVVETLLKLVAVSDARVGDLLCAILPRLLESISPLEDDMLKYMMFHTDAMNTTPEELERLRLEAMHKSPMQQTVDLCLVQLFDEGIILTVKLPVFDALLKYLAQIVSGGVGLATLCSAADVVQSIYLSKKLSRGNDHIKSLVTRSSHFLQGLKHGFTDRSYWLREHYAEAAAIIVIFQANHPASTMSDSPTFASFILNGFVAGRAISSKTLSTFLQYVFRKVPNAGVGQSLKLDFGPLLYVLKQTIEVDADEDHKKAQHEVARQFERIWLDSREFLSLNTTDMPVLFSFLNEALKSLQWEFRQQVCIALSSAVDMFDSLSAKKEQISEISKEIMEELGKSLLGPFWDGKETVPKALMKILYLAFPEFPEAGAVKVLNEMFLPQINRGGVQNTVLSSIFEAVATFYPLYSVRVSESHGNALFNNFLTSASIILERLQLKPRLEFSDHVLINSMVRSLFALVSKDVQIDLCNKLVEFVDDALTGSVPIVQISVVEGLEKILSIPSFLSDNLIPALDILLKVRDTNPTKQGLEVILTALNQALRLLKKAQLPLATLQKAKPKIRALLEIGSRQQDPVIQGLHDECTKLFQAI